MKSEFENAFDDFEQVASLEAAKRGDPKIWWRDACRKVESSTDIMPSGLAQRLGLEGNATYGDGAAAFMSRLRSQISGPFPNAGWTGKP